MTAGLRPTRQAGHRIAEGPRGEVICRPAQGDEFPSTENVSILESWNTSRDPGLSIARARLFAGQATETHRLDRTAERYLIIEGSGMVRIGAIRQVEVVAGDVVFIPPGVPQQVTNTGKKDLIFYCMCTPAFDGSDYRRCDGEDPDRGDG